ncbi:MAG: LacI family DNA-binding transcriptional regulator [Verrucomicrobiota bacterium]
MAKRVTLKDIAAKLGYSKNTVSLALRNSPQIPESTRSKIRQAADEMGYKTNAVVSHLMAQLRASQTPRFQAKLALINANEKKNALTAHPTIPTYVEGCVKRAEQRGYSFDKFWLHDPELSSDSLVRILKTRNIKGIILVGLMNTSELPEKFANVWQHFACVVTGVRTTNPTLSYCCVDHHDLTLQAFDQALKLGYKRPALVVDDYIDLLVERRFSAGFLIGQGKIPSTDRIAPFFNRQEAKKDLGVFKKWLQESQPDVIFTLYPSIVSWLEELGYQVPSDIGVIQLEWRAAQPEIAGMHQHNNVTGEAIVDMVINQIHNNEHGVPDFPRSTLIGATWIDGQSVKQR